MKISSDFRPLIRGFFFYTYLIKAVAVVNGSEFPSPHSGILFLSPITAVDTTSHSWYFRPLIRGFFFYSTGGSTLPN